MRIFCLTLFPEIIQGGLGHSIIKRAVDGGIIDIECVNIRDFAVNTYGQVDDYPYGGGAGMVMMAQPIYDAYMSIRDKAGSGSKVIYMTPQGRPFNQHKAQELSKEKSFILLCGHYEGVDERVVEEIVTDEISLGDFILTGGELAAMAVIDAVCRLVPGVLGRAESHIDESFSGNMLEYPQYTRPPEFMGRRVPEVLLSGHHGNVDKFRREQAYVRTLARRPELLSAETGSAKGKA